MWKYNLKSLEAGNFIFDTGATKGHSGGDRTVMVGPSSRQAHSNIKARPTQRKLADDFLSAKTPQAQSFQYRGNGLV